MDIGKTIILDEEILIFQLCCFTGENAKLNQCKLQNLIRSWYIYFILNWY